MLDITMWRNVKRHLHSRESLLVTGDDWAHGQRGCLWHGPIRFELRRMGDVVAATIGMGRLMTSGCDLCARCAGTEPELAMQAKKA